LAGIRLSTTDLDIKNITRYVDVKFLQTSSTGSGMIYDAIDCPETMGISNSTSILRCPNTNSILVQNDLEKLEVTNFVAFVDYCTILDAINPTSNCELNDTITEKL